MFPTLPPFTQAPQPPVTQAPQTNNYQQQGQVGGQTQQNINYGQVNKILNTNLIKIFSPDNLKLSHKDLVKSTTLNNNKLASNNTLVNKLAICNPLVQTPFQQFKFSNQPEALTLHLFN